MTNPERIPVTCTVCKDEVYVPFGFAISHPYICTCCVQRTLKRITRAELAREHGARRMSHGAVVVKGGEAT
jgi:hypothetical protein